MAKITLCLSRGTRYTVDSLRSLQLSFSSNGKTCYAPTGIKLRKDQWDQRRLVVVRHPDARKLTIDANRMLLSAQDVMLRLGGGYALRDIEAAQLKEIIITELHRDIGTKFVLPYMMQFMETRPKPNTRSVYKSTISRLIQYNPAMGTVLFDSINPGWLRKFDKWLSEHGCPSLNARSVHFRNLRAVFNAAIDDGITLNYPFRKFKIYHERHQPRSLSVKQLRTLISLDLYGEQKNARDCFLLSFYMIGINMTDLWHMADTSTTKVKYNRQKTGKYYEFKLQPEAKQLWSVMDWVRKYRSPHTLVCMINRHLKPIGTSIGVHGLTTYCARYTWATIAASLDIPKETISASLGHSQNTVTDVYITFDHSKIDRANRTVIDYVLGISE